MHKEVGEDNLKSRWMNARWEKLQQEKGVGGNQKNEVHIKYYWNTHYFLS